MKEKEIIELKELPMGIWAPFYNDYICWYPVEKEWGRCFTENINDILFFDTLELAQMCPWYWTCQVIKINDKYVLKYNA